MKRTFAIILTATMLAALSMTTFAQGRSRSRHCDSGNYDSRTYESRNYNSQGYYDNSQVYYDYGRQYGGRSTWDRHRNKLTVGAGTLGGAILGGFIGGPRGGADRGAACRRGPAP